LRTAAEPGERVQLRVRHGVVLETLTSLSREASDEPIDLTLWDTDRLRSIEGIQHLRGLVALSLRDAPLLESIAPLAGMTSLVHLDLSGCDRLAGIGPVLETLPQLQSLSLTGQPQLRVADLLPITRMPGLKGISLVGCTQLPAHMRYQYRWDTIGDLQAELRRLG
jgi:hypothetical protein